jgi:hypothetical protein
MMTFAWLLFPALAAAGFYLASTHQHLWAGARIHARALRGGAWLCTALAVAAAIAALGVWAGVFAALTALMLALVVLPCLDAWRRGGQADVG